MGRPPDIVASRYPMNAPTAPATIADTNAVSVNAKNQRRSPPAARISGAELRFSSLPILAAASRPACSNATCWVSIIDSKFNRVCSNALAAPSLIAWSSFAPSSPSTSSRRRTRASMSSII